MLNENLICFILTLVIVVLFLYLYKIEKFETATDKLTDDEINRAKDLIIDELEAQLRNSVKNDGRYIDPTPTELTSFYDDLTEKLLKNLDESKLTDLIEFEKKCLENQQLLSEIKNNSQ